MTKLNKFRAFTSFICFLQVTDIAIASRHLEDDSQLSSIPITSGGYNHFDEVTDNELELLNSSSAMPPLQQPSFIWITIKYGFIGALLAIVLDCASMSYGCDPGACSYILTPYGVLRYYASGIW